ncbi:hypothetical protein TNCV_2093651 [Trichonephila clavipes]|nr:hypothetical protein TNCV_2093651 [Trichonephila clavipes]
MSASARARASQKYKSRLSLKRGLWATHRVPQCPAPSERDGFGNVAKPTPRGTFAAANLASTANTGIPVLMDVTNEQTALNLTSTSTTGIPVLMDVTNE